MATAERMCDRIFMIFRGRKVLDGTLDEIQARTASTPSASARAGGAAALAGLPERRGGQRLRPAAGGAARPATRRRSSHALAARTAVYHFEVTRPSLHDIFVRIARQPAEREEVAAMRNKTLIVASSEFTTLTRSKAFIIGLLLMPVFMAIAIGRAEVHAATPTDIKDRTFVVVDRTGVLFAAAEGGRRRVEQRRADRAASQTAAAVPAAPGSRSRTATTQALRARSPIASAERRDLRVRRDSAPTRSIPTRRRAAQLLLEPSRLPRAARLARERRSTARSSTSASARASIDRAVVSRLTRPRRRLDELGLARSATRTARSRRRRRSTRCATLRHPGRR